MADLMLKCPVCGKVFSSIMLYQNHIKKNSRENFLKVLSKVIEVQLKKTPSSALQSILDNVVLPEIAQIKVEQAQTHSAGFMVSHKKV